MPSNQIKRDLSALCYEHHIEMRFGQAVLQTRGERTQMLAYTCPEPDCLVHYNSSHGYFMLSQNGNLSELDMVPRVRCPYDGMPMYLAETNPEKRGFRLWRCPQCDGRLTNEEGLIGQGVIGEVLQDVTEKSGDGP
jgi:hypothetical protein